MSGRRFPILRSGLAAAAAESCPRSVAWEVVEPHAARARENHQQSLERLAERGGLSPAELYAVVHDINWYDVPAEGAILAWLDTVADRKAA
jgi:hypothetical protein